MKLDLKDNSSYIAIVFFTLITLSLSPSIFIDEPWLLEPSLNYLRIGKPVFTSFPSAYASVPTWYNWARDIVVAQYLNVVGVSLFSIRLMPAVSFIVGLVFFSKTLEAMVSVRAAHLFRFFYSLQLPIFFTSHVYRPEQAIIATLAIILYLSFVQKRWHPLCGFLAGITMLFHLFGPYIVFIPSLILIVRRDFKSILKLGGGFLVGISLSLALLGIDNISNYLSHVGKFVIENSGIHTNPVLKYTIYTKFYLKGMWASTYKYKLVLLFLNLAIIIYFAVKERKDKIFLLLSAILFIQILIFSLMTRVSILYLVHPCAIFSLLVSYCYYVFRDNSKFVRSVYYLLIVLLTLQITVFITMNSNIGWDAYSKRIKMDVPGEARVLSRIENFFTFSNSNQFFAVQDYELMKRIEPQLNLSKYIKIHQIEYLIVDEEFMRMITSLKDKSIYELNLSKIDEFYDYRHGSRALLRGFNPRTGVCLKARCFRQEPFKTSVFKVGD